MSRKPRNKPLINYLPAVLITVFLIASCLAAYLTFRIVRDRFGIGVNPLATPEVIIGADGMPIPQSSLANPFEINAPLQPENGPPPHSWDGTSRINVLLLGADSREWEANFGPPRTDTMILLTLDPQSQTGGMLSLPRDIWLEIPGYGYGKINQAYFFGEADQIYGGGAGLAMDTVENFLDINIDYYVKIDFNAFVQIIDEIGGLKVDIPYAISVTPLAGHATPLQPGVQTLPGDLALAYARARNTDGGDLDRAVRQQQVIMAIRDRLLSFDLLPTLIQKSPILYQQISSGVETNLTLKQAIQIGWMARNIPEDQIRREVISFDQVYYSTSPGGAFILVPMMEEIYALRDEVFGGALTITPNALAGIDSQERMQAEEALVSILNGTTTPGLAAKTEVYLNEQGVAITEIGNATDLYNESILIDYTGNPGTVDYISGLLRIPVQRIYHRFEPENSSDVTLILGADWANDNPLP